MLKVFQDILDHKKDYLRAETGNNFEDRFEQALRREGYSPMLKGDIDAQDFKEIKSFIVKKTSVGYLPYEKHPASFVRGPFGSQGYPDFLVFTGTHVVPVEIKYSKKSQIRPLWNGGIPLANGIYIFGSYGLQDITFFLGSDVLDSSRRDALVGFLEQMKKHEADFIKKIQTDLEDKERRGFVPYVRQAYQQKVMDPRVVLNYFAHPDRAALEGNVLTLVSTL